MSLDRIVVMVPTFQEADNIAPLVQQVLDQDPRIQVLVVDDDSPDGTWRIAAEMAEQDDRVHVMRRTEQRGRGHAGIAGFQRALEMDADAVLEMDADFSHLPTDIPALLAAIEDCDVVIGSRAVAGGTDLRTGWTRRVISLAAAGYIRTVLGTEVRDPTSGFRCFRRWVLADAGLERMRAEGPEIVEEVLCAAERLGARIREVPIRFEDRLQGDSKLNTAKLLMTLVRVVRIRMRPSVPRR